LASASASEVWTSVVVPNQAPSAMAFPQSNAATQPARPGTPCPPAPAMSLFLPSELQRHQLKGVSPTPIPWRTGTTLPLLAPSTSGLLTLAQATPSTTVHAQDEETRRCFSELRATSAHATGLHPQADAIEYNFVRRAPPEGDMASSTGLALDGEGCSAPSSQSSPLSQPLTDPSPPKRPNLSVLFPTPVNSELHPCN
jgi:hypothetical protein